MLRLGTLEVVPPLVLAPMAGITDGDFRRLIRRVGGCGLVTMEFVSSEGLTRDNPRAWQMLQFSPEERETFFAVKRAFDPLGLLNPGKAVPTLARCAEYGKMHVHAGTLKFPELPRF